MLVKFSGARDEGEPAGAHNIIVYFRTAYYYSKACNTLKSDTNLFVFRGEFNPGH